MLRAVQKFTEKLVIKKLVYSEPYFSVGKCHRRVREFDEYFWHAAMTWGQQLMSKLNCFNKLKFAEDTQIDVNSLP